MREPSLLLSNTSQKWNVIGDKIRGDGWFGSTDGMHTISIHYHNFIGRLRVQGTLAEHPEDSDWFDIGLSAHSCDCDGLFLEFPMTDSTDPATGTHAYTFCGNFTFLRAAVERDYINSDANVQSSMIASHGAINKIILNR